MADEPKSSNTNTLQKILGYIPFFLFIAPLVAYLLPGINLPDNVIAALVFSSVIGVIGIAYLARAALQAFDSTKPLPPPAFLWQIIFNKLPTTVGQKYGAEARVNILLIVDKSTQSVAEDIQQRHNETSLAIDVFSYEENHKIESEILKSELESKLNKNNAVYLLWTEEIGTP